MLQHTALLESNYEGEPNETERKLMYIRAYPKTYHQKFISNGKIFEQMSEEEITQYFQILHRDEEETKPKSVSKVESTSKGAGGHIASETCRENHKTSNSNNSCTRHGKSSKRIHTPKIANQFGHCLVP